MKTCKTVLFVREREVIFSSQRESRDDDNDVSIYSPFTHTVSLCPLPPLLVLYLSPPPPRSRILPPPLPHTHTRCLPPPPLHTHLLHVLLVHLPPSHVDVGDRCCCWFGWWWMVVLILIGSGWLVRTHSTFAEQVGWFVGSLFGLVRSFTDGFLVRLSPPQWMILH